jgi:hypothetical protein
MNKFSRVLARISHQFTAANTHLPESTALRSEKVLDVLSSMPARFVPRAPCISGHLRTLASRPGEKCGLSGRFVVAFLCLFFLVSGAGRAQVGNELRREAARLEKVATNVWEDLLEEMRFGHSVNERLRLDVFNFLNGAHVLHEKAEGKRVSLKAISEVVELLQLQSQDVDRSLRKVKLGRLIVRDWEEAKASVESLSRLVTRRGSSPSSREGLAQVPENVNALRVQIDDVKAAGNFFKNEYRVRGLISGRNIVSAGIYSKDRLLKSISVPLHDRNLRENSFSVRLEPPGGEVLVRIIDNRGFVVEELIEFPSSGFLPGLR